MMRGAVLRPPWIWRRFLTVLTLAGALAGAAAAQGLQAMAYFPWWVPQSWRSAPLAELDRLLFFEFRIAPDGTIAERHGWPTEWAALCAEAARSKVPIDVVLTLFDPAEFRTLFRTEAARARLLDETLSLSHAKETAGVHLDIEIFEVQDAAIVAGYRAFVRTLAQRLRSQGKALSVFLPAGEGTALYDPATLALAEYVVVQGYDTHYRASRRAGPVAPLDGPDSWTWAKAVEAATALGLPAQRIVMGFPLYGYEWGVRDAPPRSEVIRPADTTTFAAVPEDWLPELRISVAERVQRYGATHDPVTGSSYYKFRNDAGQWREGWFEDWWSLGRKYGFVAQRGLGGMAFFLLGYDRHALLSAYVQRRSMDNLDGLIERLR
ncbi:glycosyl hydrolase family 18 protein [Candidatus Symbiobacter mobilis]|uniref:Glycosylhydrolase-like protein n=1 Tax=Candidatus Symbiobacter mobilis CR TaxID=946483 RepID=U5NBW9_9BURK|nr:glycosyl hydrolase family 18 protein [Candidatus Symbiobacter mobilis]AGX87679.1 glycosylhydrolase-like protein [Candidatus Symbiobacter mobilis CR]